MSLPSSSPIQQIKCFPIVGQTCHVNYWIYGKICVINEQKYFLNENIVRPSQRVINLKKHHGRHDAKEGDTCYKNDGV